MFYFYLWYLLVYLQFRSIYVYWLVPNLLYTSPTQFNIFLQRISCDKICTAYFLSSVFLLSVLLFPAEYFFYYWKFPYFECYPLISPARSHFSQDYLFLLIIHYLKKLFHFRLLTPIFVWRVFLLVNLQVYFTLVQYISPAFYST